MTADTETQGEYDDGGLTGPGAPTPLSALEVSRPRIEHELGLHMVRTTDCEWQGMAGLTARDIKLFVDAGYHTVERVAFTCVSGLLLLRSHRNHMDKSKIL